jgi:hypothetical protein
MALSVDARLVPRADVAAREINDGAAAFETKLGCQIDG